MSENQRREAALYLAGWLDKLSVACYAIGLFELEHAFGGLIGGTILLLAGLSIRVRVTE